MTGKRIESIIYKRFAALLVISFVMASLIGFLVQNYFQQRQTFTLLREYIEDFDSEWDFDADMKAYSYEWGWGEAEDFSITEFQDNDLLARTVRANVGMVSEISIVDERGVVTYSSAPEMIGFDLHDDDYLDDYLCLLDREGYFAKDFEPNPFGTDKDLKMVYTAITVKNYSGFILFGYDRDALQNHMEKKLWEGVTGNRIGTTGFLIVCNNDKTIVGVTESAISDTLTNDVPYDGELVLPEKDDIIYDKLLFYGKKSYVAAVKKPDYYLIASYPEDEANSLRRKYNILFMIIFLAIMSVLFVVLYPFLNKHVLSSVRSIHGSLKRITSGDLDEKAAAGGSLEFHDLSGDINDTVSKLKELIQEAKEQMASEMENAWRIQESAVPTVFPENDRFSIFASMNTAEAVGGDFYDFFMTDSNTLVFVMADVSGKGMPAALYMMRAKTLIKTYASYGLPVEKVAEKTNIKLCEDASRTMFVTAWIGFLNLRTGVLSYVHAGHTIPVLVGSEVSFVKQKINLVLGGVKRAKYIRQEITLSPGESIFLYTDGVSEAHNVKGEMYSEAKLLEVIRAYCKDAPDRQGNDFCRDVCCFVAEDVFAFEGEAPQFDDITMMCVRYEGSMTDGE